MARWARWTTIVWPGLTQLWLAGAWWGLAIGCAFAWLVNLAVVSTLVWTELIGPWSRVGVWLLLIVVWSACTWLSFRQLRDGFGAPNGSAGREDLFRHAQREYLSGNWIKSEQLLSELLGGNPHDVEANLLLASLLRRTGQLTEASGRLRKLEAMEGADKWQSELDRERKLLDEQFQNHKTSDNQSTESEIQTAQPDDSTSAEAA